MPDPLRIEAIRDRLRRATTLEMDGRKLLGLVADPSFLPTRVFIEHAPGDIAYLLEEVDRLTTELDYAKACLEANRRDTPIVRNEMAPEGGWDA